MAELEKTFVFRGGATAASLSEESTDCSFKTNEVCRSIDVRFNLASKGGGTTCVLLRMNLSDLRKVIDDVATNLPEASAEMLASAAAKANKQLMSKLRETEKAHASTIEVIETMVGKLQVVSQFVEAKYQEAPGGQDEEEEVMRDHVSEIIDSLQELT